ncbi:MAG: C40 family peptidase [Deltaproteobacteria bacterium]|nr:C40 family peptidase [Deltaproteobacteria bacterium]
MISACGSLPYSKPSVNYSHRGNEIAQRALKYIGKPYRYGGHSPRGFDCSGLIYYVYGQFGYRLPRKTKDQVKVGRHVSRKNLSPGDLVFFKVNWKGSLHGGIFLGNGKFIHAPKTGKTVQVERLDRGYYKAKYHNARRVIPKG